jgi:RNA polymerase sigma-70 factor (ECF subfamily)
MERRALKHGPERTPALRLVPGLSSMADEELMARHRDGDPGAFSLLVERHRVPTWHFVHRLLRDPARTDEVLAEVFLKVHKAAPRYEPTARFRTWLLTIAWRAAMNALERRKNQPDDARGGPEDLDTIAALDVLPSSRDPEQSMALKQAFRSLEAELARLPEGHRAAFALYYSQEMSCQEVAMVLGGTPEEIKGRLAYARKLLRERLDRFLPGGSDAIDG